MSDPTLPSAALPGQRTGPTDSQVILGILRAADSGSGRVQMTFHDIADAWRERTGTPAPPLGRIQRTVHRLRKAGHLAYAVNAVQVVFPGTPEDQPGARRPAALAGDA